MIVSDRKSLRRQVSMTNALRKGIDFLLRPDIHLLTDGRVDIDGDRVFALVQQYETIKTDTPKFEYHRKYIDIQYIVSGEEVIGWAPAERMTVTEEYDGNKDICFGTAPKGEMTPVYLKSGQLTVLYPEDAHAPKLAAGKPSHVFKIVVKVAAD
ncbi:MAG: YhcH/YjgK/YiaL family protein [Deltaproteobacteria bacterium]|nr:YhcH/YjgK/YiaL family protein [Deltaproteobacteria bacterium]